MIDDREMESNRDLFTNEIQPLIDKVYDLCAENGISLLCTCVFARNESDSEDGRNVIVDFDGYTVATGKLTMMPEQMIALAGILNNDLLKHVAEKATNTIMELHDMYERGDLDEETELTEEQQESLRVAETFALYVDALKLAGPIPFRRTSSGYEFLETLQKPDASKKDEETTPMDDELANFLSGILDDQK